MELKIFEISTTAFLLKTIEFFQVLQGALLKNCLTLQETEEKHWKKEKKNKK